ncbi:phospholipase A1 PLIP1, chloroplastic [Neltuma alba]|uniref:phospholipase A1 PLIP1, chloroplastic n=1 Tax=Neltuma alba TaxID=207710 RepID=UPI0010A51772|nr:phospholipase A1 PLIP1, chloroplastic [Prosopis alba]XP_028794721.1 phospholipase A1 PLIP1, chloroplastic [Prosopis alba]XP_028794722.1 phospholipase A1 PLIP1, chloroplastic [Prosopis alba]
MAYTTVSIPSYSAAASATLMDMAKEQSGLRRSSSNKDLCRNSKMRRSYSDNHLCHAVKAGGVQAAAVEPKLKSSRSMGIFPFQLSNSLQSFLFNPETSKDMNLMEKEKELVNIVEEGKSESGVEDDVQRANWVERLMEIKRQWRNRTAKENMDPDIINNEDEYDCDEGDGVCMVDYQEEDEEEKEEEAFDHESFSKFLVRVPWSDTKLYSQLAFLSNMAYVIPQIKAKDLRRYYGLQFVTSSLEKKAEVAKIKTKLDQDSTQVPPSSSSQESSQDNSKKKPKIQPSAAYEIAASAASYVQSRAKDLLSRGSVSRPELHSEDSRGRLDIEVEDAEEASRVAAYVAASTMTAVVAAGEKEKQEAAKDLQSLHSSPCEWFVCDDFSTYTRCFVIQGSDSLASWQANLFFEPAKFEDTNGLVHRGIYEAAKGIYEQFMPEIMEHLRKHGDRAKLQFTGHSLGGSLALLVHLMLLTRKVVSPSTLRPVVTFGSPFVFCGGRNILDELGLDDSIIHCVMMHRDIVPRAFSCNYPNHVALLLKRLNASFRSHPCLLKNKLLYSPMGKMFILQPDEKTSPAHPLLPSGCALYALDDTIFGYSKVLRAFLNQPHPLQTLSDPTAYGSEGTILRDHDSSTYLKALNAVLRQHTKVFVRRVRRQRIDHLWPLLNSPSPHSWSHEQSFQSHALVSKEIMTGV